MAEISHVRIGVPDQAALQRILREGGAQAFPQWLYAEPADDAAILWWGVRGITTDRSGEGPNARLFPRLVDDWTEAPRGLVVATVDADRAARELGELLGLHWETETEDAILDARCRRAQLGRAYLVVAEPIGEGSLAASLARFGEGPVAVALDGGGTAGRHVERNPVTLGRAAYLRVGGPASPTLIFLRA